MYRWCTCRSTIWAVTHVINSKDLLKQIEGRADGMNDNAHLVTASRYWRCWRTLRRRIYVFCHNVRDRCSKVVHRIPPAWPMATRHLWTEGIIRFHDSNEGYDVTTARMDNLNE